MQILNVAGSFYPAVAYGGPIESNRALCQGLAVLGADVKVLTTNTSGAGKLAPEFAGWRPMDGYEVFYANRWLWRDLSPALAGAVLRHVPKVDVVYVMGTYSWFLPIVVSACRRHGKPVVVSPRATLLPEARAQKAFKKRLFDRVLQRQALASVTAFHATSEGEAEALRTHLPGAHVAVIPNGVYVPEAFPERTATAAPFALFVGRLHPYKRVDRILRAFADALQHADPRTPVASRWSLCVAGDGEESYRKELETLVRDCGIAERVRFVGHVAGEQKSRLFAEAGFVVQAPNPENFGNVVAEALAHATPALVGKGLPWAALGDERCGEWVDDSQDALAAGMGRLMALSFDERRAMGERGRRWMARAFSWGFVAERMMDLFRRVSETPARPISSQGGHREAISASSAQSPGL